MPVVQSWVSKVVMRGRPRQGLVSCQVADHVVQGLNVAMWLRVSAEMCVNRGEMNSAREASWVGGIRGSDFVSFGGVSRLKCCWIVQDQNQ